MPISELRIPLPVVPVSVPVAVPAGEEIAPPVVVPVVGVYEPPLPVLRVADKGTYAGRVTPACKLTPLVVIVGRVILLVMDALADNDVGTDVPEGFPLAMEGLVGLPVPAELTTELRKGGGCDTDGMLKGLPLPCPTFVA